MLVVEELKKRREELGAKIEALRGEIASLEQQRAAFDIV
jgi:prefoldin subunit 5